MSEENNLSDLDADFVELEKIAKEEQLKADFKDYKLENQQAKIDQQREQTEFDRSPTGLWQAAIRECAPLALSFVPDLAINEAETEALAQGLSPALAKHFPINESFTLPVEIIALSTIYIVFKPKLDVMRAKRLANEQLKEVNEDAAPKSQ